jgi:hypothetical protein
VAVFTGTVDPSIKHIWNRINLAIIFHCLPSAIDKEANIDIQASKIVLSAREEMKEKQGDEQ